MIAADLAFALDPPRLMAAGGITPDPWQRDLLRSQGKRHLLLCTRQAGKSTTTAALALWEALYRAPALILLLSPSLRQSQELFKKVVDFYHAIGGPIPVAEESALRLSLVNGSRIIALPGTEATIRGYSGVRLLVIDEASRVDDGLYYSVRPMLAVSGGRLVALTTPFGKRGFFFDAWENGGPEWERVKVTAHDCPRISPEFLEEERAASGDWWFSQEYLCEFRDTVDQVFATDLILKAMNDDTPQLFGGQSIFGKL
jgi:hypothetical protein